MTKRDAPNIVVYPPFAALAATVAAFALHMVWPVDILPKQGFINLSGWVAIGGALWLVSGAARAFSGVGTPVSPRKTPMALATDGPFRSTRNPMYLGMVLALIGIGFLGAIDWAVFSALALWAVLHFGVVLREEAYLSQKFGHEYEAFLQQTRRWF